MPALLEYLPYRIVDGTALRDARHHPWYAGHGYASVRVDQRGSGNSEGLLLDEYLPQEQLDAAEVIAWLAEQPWCSGAVACSASPGRLQRPAGRGAPAARAEGR